jgi:hypothetical protein
MIGLFFIPVFPSCLIIFFLKERKKRKKKESRRIGRVSKKSVFLKKYYQLF